MKGSSHRLSAEEHESYREQGYVVRTSVFTPDEVAAIRDECEQLVDGLVRHRRGERVTAGSYTFDADAERTTIIKWEGDTEIVHGIEPFAHLSPPLNAWAHDVRFLEPMMDILGVDEPALFTEKLNLKRPGHGGANPLHQDHPYWVDVAEVASEVATAMLFLDDSTLANGCLHVVPGSHRDGEWAKRTDGDRFAGNEIDAAAYPDVAPVPVEVPAGSVVMFGALLVHQSAQNRSDRERRAILYSYQPPGRRTQVENLRRSLERARSGRSQSR